VTGRRIRYESLEEGAYRQRLTADQTPGRLIDAFTSMFASVREGRFDVVSGDVRRLTGEPQQPYAEFVRSAVLP
jgi:hypothetical protein